MAAIFWDNNAFIMVVYLEEGRRTHGAYYGEELRRLRQIVKKIKRKLTWCVCSCQIMHRPARFRVILLLWQNAASRSLFTPVFSRFSPFYLCVLISTWGTWKKFLFWRDKQTGTALQKVHRGKGDYIAQFQSTGAENFFIVPHTVTLQALEHRWLVYWSELVFDSLGSVSCS